MPGLYGVLRSSPSRAEGHCKLQRSLGLTCARGALGPGPRTDSTSRASVLERSASDPERREPPPGPGHARTRRGAWPDAHPAAPKPGGARVAGSLLPWCARRPPRLTLAPTAAWGGEGGRKCAEGRDDPWRPSQACGTPGRNRAGAGPEMTGRPARGGTWGNDGQEGGGA